jgi:hypothetical protein
MERCLPRNTEHATSSPSGEIASVCLVAKLRYIQLYEVDFNFFQQLSFGKEAMNSLTDSDFSPEEHFSKK